MARKFNVHDGCKPPGVRRVSVAPDLLQRRILPTRPDNLSDGSGLQVAQRERW